MRSPLTQSKGRLPERTYVRFRPGGCEKVNKHFVKKFLTYIVICVSIYMERERRKQNGKSNLVRYGRNNRQSVRS